jgi:thiol-disulfide isomerase/thioredoxin
MFVKLKRVLMKKLIILSVFAFFGLLMLPETFAQSGKVPPFRMIQADGKIYKAEFLPQGKPIVIIYFSPDCEDCLKLTEELLDRINDFKNVSFAMVTFQSVENVSRFVIKYNIGRYNNIFVGTEEKYQFLRSYYKIVQFPLVVLYNKNGDFIVRYNTKEIDLDNLLYRIKTL